MAPAAAATSSGRCMGPRVAEGDDAYIGYTLGHIPLAQKGEAEAVGIAYARRRASGMHLRSRSAIMTIHSPLMRLKRYTVCASTTRLVSASR